VDESTWELIRGMLSREGRLLIANIDPQRLSREERDRVLQVLNSVVLRTGEGALHQRLAAAGVLPEAALPRLAQRDALLAEAAELDAERERMLGEARQIQPTIVAPPSPAQPAEGEDGLDGDVPAAVAIEPAPAADDAAAETQGPRVDPRAAALQRRAVLAWERADFNRREAEHREQHANRLALSALMGEALMPPPAGATLLAASGRADPWATDTLLQGRPPNDQWGLTELPWRAWVEPMRLWWAFALLLGVCAVCLTLIVHPQWSRRELLPYPIARFVEEASERKDGAWLPEIARIRTFWIAFGMLVLLHLVNGMSVWASHLNWTDALPSIPLRLDFSGIAELFPNARRAVGFHAYAHPTIYLSVVAFAFFLTTTVSFSLGISHLLFIMLAAFLIAQGSNLERDYAGARPYNMLMFGGYAALAVMILYTGRRYYLSVAAGMVGLPRKLETPTYSIWAARGLLLAVVLAVVVIKQAGLDWLLATAFVLLALLIFLVMTRIVVETGAFFMQPTWLPVGILTGLFGFEAIGPTAYIILALASIINVVDPREVIMPYLANGLQMAERTGKASPAVVAPWMLLVVIGGFFVAGVATIYLQYNHGLAQVDGWTKEALPTMGFENLQRFISDAQAQQTLADATAVTTGERISRFSPIPGSLTWLSIGAALVIATAVARLRLPWWPLHPIAFLVWGTYPIIMFAFSFLLGWMVKAGVMRTSGARGYHNVKPVMIGIIAGELFAGLMWIIVGAVYFFVTNQRPAMYSIFPQ
jgi:hypothetical protein